MSYYCSIDYNRNGMYEILFSLPEYCKYFASDPSTSIESIEQLKDTDDGSVIDLRGISHKTTQLRPGIYIRGGKKVIVR